MTLSYLFTDTEGVSAPTKSMGMTLAVPQEPQLALTAKKGAMTCKPLIPPNRQQTHVTGKLHRGPGGLKFYHSEQPLKHFKRHRLERFRRATSFPASTDGPQPLGKRSPADTARSKH